MTNFSDFRDLGWILVLLVGVVVVAIAIGWKIAQRKKLSAERHAAWKAHRDWLQSSAVAHTPPTTPPSNPPSDAP